METEKLAQMSYSKNSYQSVRAVGQECFTCHQPIEPREERWNISVKEGDARRYHAVHMRCYGRRPDEVTS